MCTVLHYRHTCGHTLTRRPSRCAGTRSKVTRSGRKAACSADGYLTLQRGTPCSACLRDEWTARWAGRLSRAREFYAGVVGRGGPGEEEVRGLVRGLEEEYEVEAWEVSRGVIPYRGREAVGRVDVKGEGERRVGKSLLRREVRAEEVVERVVGERGYEEGEGWVPNTDQVHSVETNYEVFGPGVDEGFLEEVLREDGFGGDGGLGDLDSMAGGWSWEGGEVGVEKGHEDDDFDNIPAPETDSDLDPDTLHGDSTTTSPGASRTQTLRKPPTDGPPLQDEAHLQQVEQTIAAFWKAVDADDVAPTASQPSSSPHAPDPATMHTTSPEHNTDSTTSSLHYSLTDGPSDAHTLAPSDPPACSSQRPDPGPATPRVTNYRQAKYDGFRMALLPLKKDDPRKYYAQWLVECRLEIREVVGPEGVRVYDPPWRG